jgi:hypothetical protein
MFPDDLEEIEEWGVPLGSERWMDTGWVAVDDGNHIVIDLSHHVRPFATGMVIGAILALLFIVRGSCRGR